MYVYLYIERERVHTVYIILLKGDSCRAGYIPCLRTLLTMALTVQGVSVGPVPGGVPLVHMGWSLCPSAFGKASTFSWTALFPRWLGFYAGTEGPKDALCLAENPKGQWKGSSSKFPDICMWT